MLEWVSLQWSWLGKVCTLAIFQEPCVCWHERPSANDKKEWIIHHEGDEGNVSKQGLMVCLWRQFTELMWRMISGFFHHFSVPRGMSMIYLISLVNRNWKRGMQKTNVEFYHADIYMDHIIYSLFIDWMQAMRCVDVVVSFIATTASIVLISQLLKKPLN